MFPNHNSLLFQMNIRRRNLPRGIDERVIRMNLNVMLYSLPNGTILDNKIVTEVAIVGFNLDDANDRFHLRFGVNPLDIIYYDDISYFRYNYFFAKITEDQYSNKNGVVVIRM